MSSETILVTGANGQIGTDLVLALREKYGAEQVIASDIREPQDTSGGPFEQLDVLNEQRVVDIVEKHGVTQIYHLAALLSARSEMNPKGAWNVNMDGLFSLLDVAVEHKVKRVFWPSSIAAFGPTTPKVDTAQFTVMDPSTVYGISKLAGELWCQYYYAKKGLDVRSIRYPGLISYKADAGGGTTDYAVEIFYEAIKEGKFECFLEANTSLPMMYMPDAIRGTIELMEADADKLSTRAGYNFSAMSFSPAEIAASIQKHIPEFEISYKPDFRQQIAEGWPQAIDDSLARKDWGWQHEYDLDSMVADMLTHIREKVSVTQG